MKTYSRVPEEIDRMISAIKREYYSPQLDAVSVDAVFVYDADDSTKHSLSSGGYTCAATIRATAIDERVLGVADAVITIERSTWLTRTAEQRLALLDHELHHLHACWDEEKSLPVLDSVSRPKLKMRKHDHQFGWFDEVASRHGRNSIEVMQATALVEATGQLYWDFEAPRRGVAKLESVKRAPAEAGAA